MRRFHLLGILGLAIFGCNSSSVHPILTEDDFVHDIDLSGRWRQIEVPEQQGPPHEFTLQGWPGNARYDMTLSFSEAEQRSRSEREQKREKVIPAEYEVAIGKLGQSNFLQARRSESITEGPSFFEGVVTYAFARFERRDDVLLVYTIDDQALENLLPKTTLAHIRHKPSDWVRNIVITDSTPRVQEFLKQHHPTIFHSEPVKFRRLPAKSDGQSQASQPAIGPK